MKRRLLVVALFAIAAALISSAVIANLSAGAKAPSFTLQALDGKTFVLDSNFKAPGKVVVLDIWATWCPPCRAEIPFVIGLQKKYAKKAVTIVGVAIDQRKSDVDPFVKKMGINYTICSDPSAQAVGDKYQVRGIPATYVIDKKGVIRFVHDGFRGAADMAKLDKEIASLLK